MRCAQCGAEVGNGDRFCGRCGASIAQRVAASIGAADVTRLEQPEVAAAGVWQSEAARPAPSPMATTVSPPERRLGLGGGVVGVVGALLIIVACALPYAHYTSDSGTTSPSIFNPGFTGGLWYAAERIAVILMGIVAAFMIVFSTRHMVQIAGAAVLVAIGLQTFFFFMGIVGEALSSGVGSLGSGSVIGLAGGLCLAMGGLISAVSLRTRAMSPGSG